MNDPENRRVLGCPKINESAPTWVRLNNLEWSESEPPTKILVNQKSLGKTGTKLTCKCSGDSCKWRNDAKKTINGKKVKTYMCE